MKCFANIPNKRKINVNKIVIMWTYNKLPTWSSTIDLNYESPCNTIQ